MKRCSELDDFDAFDMKESRSSCVEDGCMEERKDGGNAVSATRTYPLCSMSKEYAFTRISRC